MELANIERLLEKYFEATTTVAEEKTLQKYFSEEEVAPHLEDYKSMFTYFSKAKDEQFTKHVPLKTKRNYYKWISVAAIAVLLIGIYFSQPPVTSEGQYTQAEIESAEKALAILSSNLNMGTINIEHLKSFTKGTEKIGHLNEFKNSTDKLLYNNN